ncbi:MAG: hypothetical protein WC819_02085 [Parcubacteria group bacterium]|jgi:opacity protein-like surface antigen
MKKLLCLIAMCLLIASSAYAGDEEQPPEPKVKFRGIQSVDAFDITHSKFSPFGGGDKDRHGESTNIKARVRPLRMGKLDAGGYVTYTEGSADTYDRKKGQWSNSDYRTVGGGVSGVYHHDRHRETEAELGILRQETDSWNSKLSSQQTESQIEARLRYGDESGRGAGEKLLPFWEVGIHYIHPYNVSYHDSKGKYDPYDNRQFVLFGSADLYDWYLDDVNHWRLTPTFNANLGYLWGKDSGYLQGGFGTKLAWYEQELIDIRILNPRWMFNGDGSRIYDYIATLKVDNVFRALWAAQTETYVSNK